MSSLISAEVRDRVESKYRELRDAGGFLSKEDLRASYDLFRKRFGPEQLARVQGKELLETMFLHGNKDSLVYWLEFKNDEELPGRFGGIAGGSAYKFILFKQKESGQWITGSPKSPEVISEETAMALAATLRDQFVACCKVLDRLSVDSTLADYKSVNGEMKRVGGEIQHKAFAHKYFALLYPEVLDDFHAIKFQQHQFMSLGIKDGLNLDRYESAYYFKELCRELKVPMNELTSTLNALFGLPRRYWRIGTSIGNGPSLWPLFRKDGMAAIGWGELGDLSELGSSRSDKTRLAERLMLEFGQSYKPTASRQAGEIISFRHKIEVGDIILAADGEDVLGLGEVTGEYEYVEDALHGTRHRRQVNWSMLPERPFKLPTQEALRTTCKEIRKPENALFIEDKLQDPDLDRPLPDAGTADPGRSSTMPPLPPKVQQVKAVLDRKGQVILYGPPGTGKTYWARLAAQELAAREAFGKPFDQLDSEEKEVVAGASGLVRACTFHPAFGYEDLIEGYRPTGQEGALNFNLKDGLFKKLCEDARKAPKRTHYLLIDEINRGDIPRIFGELITLLEMDKRGMVLNLPLSGAPFSVPPNVRVIGTMNTADRSIALLDTALRRRFGFIELMTDYSLLGEMVFEGLPIGKWLELLNGEIRHRLGHDGRNLQVGHAFFLHKGAPITDATGFLHVLFHDIVPLLEEYFYESPGELAKLLGTVIMDPVSSQVKQDVLKPGRRPEVFTSLAQAFPDLQTSTLSVKADEEDEDEEDQEEDAAP